ncbi:MAG: hypothetical protein H7Y60_17820 [Rhodospirillaceae bacterium]|nr:hypothetical protein [Rhodospirillales bacterium]
MYVSQRSVRAALQVPADMLDEGEVLDFGASYTRALDDQRYRLNSDSRQKAIVDAYDGYVEQIHQTTGQRLANPVRVSDSSAAFADSMAGDPERFAQWEAERWTKFDNQVAELAAKHPGLQVQSRDDIMAGIATKAKDLKAKAEAPGDTRVGWTGMGEFLGRAQGTMEDPLNAISLLFGAGGGRAVAAAGATLTQRFAVGATNVARVGAQEAAINATTEAAIQGQVAGFNREMGIEYGAGEMAANVGLAALGGAVLGGGMEGARLAFTGDAKAASKVMEVEQARQAMNPYPPTPDGERIFSEAGADVLRAMREGRPIPAEVEQRFTKHRAAALSDLAQRSTDKATGNAEMVAYGVLPPRQLDEIGERVLALMPDGSTLDNAVRRMDAGGLRHAFDRHGNDPIPFRPEHAAHVADVVERGELVKVEPNNMRADLPYVERRLLVDGNWLHVGETVVGTKRPTLTFQTAFWNKGPGNDGAGGPKGGNRPVAPVSPAAMPEAPRLTPAANGDSPAVTNMRPAPTERKTLPPELAPPASKRPENLVGWLKRQGGVNDTDGWLAHMGVDNTARPGLIAGKGLHLDDAALRAWEEGFFPEFHDRPDMDSLRLAMADELGPEGFDRVRGDDTTTRLEWDAYDGMMADLDRMGVDPYGKSWDDVQAAVTAARAAEQAENDLWKEALAFIDGGAAKNLDEETARISRARSALFEDDVMVPVGLVDDDGRAVTVSAREAMDALDNEADAWDGAVFCLGKVA